MIELFFVTFFTSQKLNKKIIFTFSSPTQTQQNTHNLLIISFINIFNNSLKNFINEKSPLQKEIIIFVKN